MCGLSGFWRPGGLEERTAREASLRMARTLVHRGPDDEGVWIDHARGVALAHRRLSIVDLSPAGHQPMMSPSGRYVIAFNGEIYNHRDLRLQIDQAIGAAGERIRWRGHSDTETVLAGFDLWGVKEAVQRCVGMFAVAVWDREKQELVLGRDRIGEKPLYYGWQGSGPNSTFLFGSELKALRAHSAFSAEINRNALCLFFRHNYIPAPHSIYNNIYKLPPGNLLRVSSEKREPVYESYWSLAEVAMNGSLSPHTGSESEVVTELERVLATAIGQQMVADVPLGAFLSGGVDSSLIVALMQKQSSRPVSTFSIGFNEEGYNEAVYAAAVAKHLGTDHSELYVSSKQALDVIPRIPNLYCEPFSDSSQIPTFLVAQLARKKVTVSLSGDAGDELFSGYNRYLLAAGLWQKISRFPSSLRSVVATGVQAFSPTTWNRLVKPFQKLAPQSRRLANVGDKLHKAAGLLGARQIDDLYLGLVTHWEPSSLVLGAQEPLTILNGRPAPLSALDPVQRMMALDALTYLPDDILVKVDRAAMGVSLETRVPFLDHRVVEFAWRVPQSMKIKDGAGKWVLRQILHRHVPRTLIERPKMGFGVPIDAWLRGPLKDWAESLLAENRLKQEGYLNVSSVRAKWVEHLSGKRNWQYHLWDVLIFQAWLDSQESSSGVLRS